MRVYLMADFGKGPRCFWRGIGHPLDERVAGAHRDLPHDNVMSIMANASEARAWWLVEAESADAARKGIAHAIEWPDPFGNGGKLPRTITAANWSCRILASGGAK